MGWPLNMVFLVALGVIILYDFVFWGWPELFPAASRLWELAYLLALTWVASYMFFYINVHLKAVREKETLRPFLYTYTRRVVGDAMSIILAFKICNADPFVGIDLDDCRDAQRAEVAPWAQKILDRVQEGYVEASPSGTGVHIIVEGTVRDGRTRKKVRVDGEVVGQVEMYGRGKFFTITGDLL